MTRDELVEVVARAIHETMSAQAVIEYLDNPFDASAITRAALAAIEAQGLAVVPVEHTDEMAKAFWKDGRYFATSYRAMITPEEMREMAEDLNATDAGRDFALADKLERASAMLRSIAAEREAGPSRKFFDEELVRLQTIAAKMPATKESNEFCECAMNIIIEAMLCVHPKGAA